MEVLKSLIDNKGITMHYTFGAPKHILYTDSQASQLPLLVKINK